MTSDLDLRRLRFFLEVVKQGGFSSAAKVLSSTQSTVSKAVKQLEDELGVVLLERSSTRTDLTDEGKVVYDKGLQLLAAADQLRTDLDELMGLRRGKLAIGIPRMGTSMLLADTLAAYKLKYPQIDLDVEIASSSELEQRLRKGELDVAAIFDPVPDDLYFQPVLDDELMVLLPTSSSLSTLPSVKLAQLRGVPLFIFQSDIPASRSLIEAFEAADVEPRIGARSDHLDLLYELVRSGAGASFIPSRLAAIRPQRSTVALPLHGLRISWRLSLGWVRGRHLSHAARAWIDHMGAHTAATAESALR